jgi:hypothetical protein
MKQREDRRPVLRVAILRHRGCIQHRRKKQSLHPSGLISLLAVARRISLNLLCTTNAAAVNKVSKFG